MLTFSYQNRQILIVFLVFPKNGSKLTFSYQHCQLLANFKIFSWTTSLHTALQPPPPQFQVGKILLSRKALADKLVGGAGDASSYRLHSLREADEELLGDLMSRYSSTSIG